MKRRSELKRTAAALLVGAAAVGLFGCGNEQPVPAPKASQASAAGPGPGVPDTTPKAGDVFKAPAAPAQTSTNAQRTDASHELTKQEESAAMPMPGQANDHSTLAKDPATR